ncbi:MAG TPA: hypothetical protein VD886_09185 [Herpetosiphonaceae bacterium]|nr:hypothetical protein [Herpetosiphonaceae bacterium]
MDVHFPNLDPLNWETIQPIVDDLLSTELGPHNIGAWLRRWSALRPTWASSASGPTAPPPRTPPTPPPRSSSCM